MREILNKYGNDISAFLIRRVDIINGKPVLGYFYNYQVRLFRRDKVLYKGLIHETPQILGKVIKIG